MSLLTVAVGFACLAQQQAMRPNVSVKSIEYNIDFKLVLKYEVQPGRDENGFPTFFEGTEEADVELFFTRGTNNVVGGKLLSKQQLDSLEVGVHEQILGHQGILPARFDRVVAVVDRKRSLEQRSTLDDSKAVLAKFAPGYTRRWSGDGVGVYVKGSGMSAVVATVVELRRATARTISNPATSNVTRTPDQWWSLLNSSLPAGRPLRAMINTSSFEPALETWWWMPNVDLGFTHGLKAFSSGVRFEAAKPKAWSWAIGWNAGYSSIAMGYGNYRPWILGAQYRDVLGGIGPANIDRPTLPIGRNWLAVGITDAPVIISQDGNNLQFGYDTIVSLFSPSQTAVGMLPWKDNLPFIQLDAGGSTTYYGPNMKYSAVSWPRYLPSVVGFYSQ